MEKELLFSVTLADCDVQTFRAGGPGGQNQNKRDTGVRVIHRASGARGESREERSQLQNKKLAFRRMAESAMFQAWVARQSDTYKRIERQAQEWASNQMDPALLKVETYHNGKWKTTGSTGPSGYPDTEGNSE
jgi:protein subunit release factor B